MNKKKSISVFFPCFNDEHTIGQLVEDAFNVLEKISSKHEVIVVDDGSTDNSRTVLKDLSRKYKNLKLIFHNKNQGYGAALRSGFKNSTYELIFYTDGDGQYNVKELPLLIQALDGKTNFVNGFKTKRSDSMIRIIAGYLHTQAVNVFFSPPIKDVDCDFRLIKKDVLDAIALKSNSGALPVELVKKAEIVGALFKEVPVHHQRRRYGTSQFFKMGKIFATYVGLFKLWFELQFKRRKN